MPKPIKVISSLSLVLLLSACATYKPQYGKSENQIEPTTKAVEHTFYLIGDAGNSQLNKKDKALQAFEEELEKASANSTAIFLGDNIYEKGLPEKGDENYDLASYRLRVQTEATKNFKGQALFIPGNHDWYHGLDGLKRQEKFVEKKLGKNTFLPENGCPIEKVHVSDDIELIIIDSQWYITNWNKHPKINDDCEFKTRNDFLDEFSSLIKKARGKTTIVALHHPLYTNGSHGGQYSFSSHMKPLPVLGTLKNVIRKTSGVANVDLQNARYNEMKRQLVALAQVNRKVVFVSGHDHNLQYIVKDNLHQIVSGSGSKVSAVRNMNANFGYGTHGYAILKIYKDGSSHVQFYSTDDEKLVYQGQVLPPNVKPEPANYPSEFPETVAASIYTDDEVKATGTRRFFWGKRYRKYYGTKVNAPTVNLDTLFGGLKPVRKGGGNQSKSLRLEDKNGAQYVMRALRKQALQYLQAVLFKDQYIEGQFDDTATEDLLLDVFTGSHPYAPFVVGDLSDAVDVYHTNPTLYYVPKQNALGAYNADFGNELYMIEEHTSEGHSDLASFGFQDKLLSTIDMMEKLHKDEDVVIDEGSYIRARLFDMLIGDWDRHQDQWRWIQFKEDGKKVFRPMPRDRDQAFSIMSDGLLLDLAVKLLPAAKLLRNYSDDLKDVKGVNFEPYPLDKELIVQSDKKVWNAQVKMIQDGLTDEVIETAFLNMPIEVRDKTVEEIKRKLKARRANLQKIADRYYDLLNNVAVIKGTNKDDWFDIERLPKGKTKITVYRIKKGEKKDKFIERIYNHNETKEIWIYGLGDDDVFHVYGSNSDKEIKVRLVGGQNKDTYNIKNGKRITYYDYKSKSSIVKTNKGHKKFTDNYDTNAYDYRKLKNNTTQVLPSFGANPDDGFRVGANATYTAYGFERNPFTSQHRLSAVYYFATNGFDFNYKGEFANIFPNVNFGLEAQFNSPNFAVNFFGFGNETPNPEADENDGLDVNMDFNRVKIRTLSFMPSLIWRGETGGSLKFGISYESNEVERTSGRFIESISADDAVFDNQNFYGIDAVYSYVNKDDNAFPTLGFQTLLNTGYKNNTTTTKGFGYIISELGVDYKLVSSGKLVLATNLRGHINFGDGFEFYQGATLGSKTGLRGYRFQRFTGKTAFSQSTDVRWHFGRLKTGLLPIHIGIYGGVDYGRVWLENDNSDKWHNSLGGGLFVNMAEMMTAQLSAFNSSDGLRFAFQLGFDF